MGKLWPTLQHQPGETPVSFASRLAFLHGERARSFCRDMRLDFQGIVDGRPAAVAGLAALAGQWAEGLMAEAIARTGERSYAWRGEDLPRSALRRGTVMVCARCLLDDLAGATEHASCAPFSRTTWQLAAIRTCQRHEVALVTAATASTPQELHDFRGSIDAFLCRISAEAEACLPQRPSDLELYLTDRLNGICRGLWLDDLAWHAVVETCEVIGAVTAYGRDVRIGRIPDAAWHAASDMGFAIASDGPMGVTELLNHLDRSYPRTRAATEGPQAFYGALYKWLYEADERRPDLDSVKAVVADHVTATKPVAAGVAILGHAVAERKVHSIRTAALEWRCHPKRLRKILRASGIIGSETDGEVDSNVTFEAEKARGVLDRAANSISQSEVEAYINAGRVQTALLADAGLIKPFIEIDRKGRRSAALNFAKADLDGFLERLLNRAEAVGTASEGELSIPTAAHRANCRAIEIVRLILTGRLAWTGRLGGIAGYSSVLVRLAEVKARIHGTRAGAWTARELEERLATNTKVVKALITRGLLPTYQAVNPINRCPTTLIAEADVAAFRKKFISLSELSRAQHVHMPILRKQLAARLVKPALDAEIYGATFYHRFDV